MGAVYSSMFSRASMHICVYVSYGCMDVYSSVR